MQAGWPSRGKRPPFSGFRARKDGFYGPAISGLKTATPCAGASSSYAAMMQWMPSGIGAKSATQRKLRNDGVTALLLSFAAEGELEMSKYQGFGATAESSTSAPCFATNPSRNRGGLAERSNDLAIPQFVQHSLRGRLG